MEIIPHLSGIFAARRKRPLIAPVEPAVRTSDERGLRRDDQNTTLRSRRELYGNARICPPTLSRMIYSEGKITEQGYNILRLGMNMDMYG